MTRVIICGVVCCHLTVCSRCPVRGGILCKLWKAITDYRQKPAWGLSGDNHSEKSGLGSPNNSVFLLYTSVFKGFLERRLHFNVRTRQLSNHGRQSWPVARGRDDDVIDDDSKLRRGFVAAKIFFEKETFNWEVPPIFCRTSRTQTRFVTGGLEMTFWVGNNSCLQNWIFTIF